MLKNYEKNKLSFIELKKLLNDKAPTIFSFGCGLGLDKIGADDVFKNLKYCGIDATEWAIKKTESYKEFKPKLPKTVKYDTGIYILKGKYENTVLCFFNSLFTVSENSDLDKDLTECLKNKDNFYIVCNFTINKNYHMPKEEQDFLTKLMNNLKNDFRFSKFDILDGKGIIIHGVKV